MYASMNVVVWDVNHLFDSSEDVGEGDHGEEGHGDHHSESGWNAANVGEDIHCSHGERTTAVSCLGVVASADLALASAVCEVIGAIGNASADSGGSVSLFLAVELDVAKETSLWACAAEVLGLNAVSVSSAPWTSGSITSNNCGGGISFNSGVSGGGGGGSRVLGGNGREEAGSESEGDELVHLIYLYYYKSLFDNSQYTKRRMTTPRDAIFKFIETSH